MKKKICTKCKISKPLTEFRLRGKYYVSGDVMYSSECCDCTAKYFKKYWKKNMTISVWNRERRKRNPQAQKARNKFKTAVINGDIFPQPCQECGIKKTVGHHPDYKKPLEIVWLCHKHHMRVHNQRPR